MPKARSFVKTIPIAPMLAAMFGIAAAALVATTPQWLFENTVASMGLGDFLSVAKPPLGLKARLLAIFFAFAVSALVAWIVGRVVERFIDGPTKRPAWGEDELDLEPYVDAALPARRAPISAERELGAPLMSDEALATAAPLVLEAPEPVPEIAEEAPEDPVLAAPLSAEEFDLPPLDATLPPVDGETSIDALIRRLEAGLARRDGPRPPDPAAPLAVVPTAPPHEWMVPRDVPRDTLDEDTSRALGTLRRMAAR